MIQGLQSPLVPSSFKPTSLLLVQSSPKSSSSPLVQPSTKSPLSSSTKSPSSQTVPLSLPLPPSLPKPSSSSALPLLSFYISLASAVFLQPLAPRPVVLPCCLDPPWASRQLHLGLRIPQLHLETSRPGPPPWSIVALTLLQTFQITSCTSTLYPCGSAGLPSPRLHLGHA